MLKSSVNSTRHLAQECERKFMLLEEPQSKAERQLQQYIIDSCTGRMQTLIPFISTNATTTELVNISCVTGAEAKVLFMRMVIASGVFVTGSTFSLTK